MSVLNKIKALTENAESMAKEKPVVTITSDCLMVVENYNSIRLFGEDRVLVELNGFELDIVGIGLVIEFFSPSRIMLRGKIRGLSYVPEKHILPEEL